MKKYIKLSTYAKNKSIHYLTAYKHFHNGKIKGYQDKDTGTIYIEDELETKQTDWKQVVLYARVSSSQNKSNLETQMERLRLYAIAKWYTIVNEYKEVASGLNENRKVLETMLKKDNYDIVIVEHKDRLTRFGFNYIKLLLEQKQISIEIINQSQEDKKDLLDDFISIITLFCARIYWKRRTKRQTEIIINQLNNVPKNNTNQS